MLPKTHIILGFIFSVLIFFLFPQMGLIGASLIFFSSFLIDFDHYLYYLFKKKDPNPRNSVKWFMKHHKEKTLEKFDILHRSKNKKTKAVFCVLHTFEISLLLAILSLFFYPFFFILIGILFHSIVDVIDLESRNMLHLREFSIILYTFRKNNKNWVYF